MEADDDVRVLMSVWREGTKVGVLVAEAAQKDVAEIAESEGVTGEGRDHVLAALAVQVSEAIEGEALERREDEALPHIVHHPNPAQLLAWARLHNEYPALEPGAVVRRFERDEVGEPGPG